MSAPSRQGDASIGNVWARRMPALVLVVLFLVGASVPWALGWTRGRAACDQYEYHLPTIREFARHLAHPDLTNYLSATTPGYHLMLACVDRLVNDNAIFLQIVGSVFTIALLGVVGWWYGREGARRGRGWIEITAVALPVVCGQYVFTSGVFLLPDNIGWLGVLGVLVPLLTRRVTGRVLVWCSLAMVLLVLVRQSHLWVVVPVVGAAWLAASPANDETILGAITRAERRFRMTIFAVLACVPAMLILWWFVRLWHGPVPPFFRQQTMLQGGSTINWATPPFILAVIGCLAPFYAGWWWCGLVKLWRESRPALVLAAGAAIVWVLLITTTHFREPRSSGLWEVSKLFDRLAIAGRVNLVLLVLAPIGAVVLAAWLAMIDDRRRGIAAATIGAFIAAQAANANAWQRYHEPFLLIFLGWIGVAFGPPACEAGGSRHGPKLATWRVVGPVVLAVLLAMLTVGGLLTGRDPIKEPRDIGYPGVVVPAKP